MKTYLLLLLLVLSAPTAFAQTEKYLVYFKNKPNTSQEPSSFLSARSLARRQKQNIALQPRDYPVSAAYVDSLKKTGVTVLYTTKWLNGALVEGTGAQLEAVKKLSVVKSASQVSRVGKNKRKTERSIQPVQSNINGRTAAINYGVSLPQLSSLEVPTMHADGFFGQGMHIAVLDGGFGNANAITCLDTLFKNGRILGTYDFVSHHTNVYDDDDHGTNVLTVMGGYAPGMLIGPAFRANYWLFRTEDVDSEKLIEEINWLFAVERADSLGVDVINSSLGYFDFDTPAYNHSKSEFDGNTTIIARAADFAAASGMLVVVSAGNEGDGIWGYISTPADGDSVLAVGAVDATGKAAAFTSPGPSADGQIKPDVSAMGVQVVIGNSEGGFRKANGTSFAAPLVAAMAAGVWQAFPELTANELLEHLRESGSKASTPNNLVGYGTPSYLKIRQELNPNGIDDEGLLQGSMLYPNPTSGRIHLNLSHPVKNASLQLYNLAGQLVWKQTLSGNTASIDLSAQSKGLFLLQLVSEQGTKQWKVVLE